MFASLVMKMVLFVSVDPSGQRSNINLVVGSTWTRVGIEMLCSPKAIPTTAGPGGCCTPSTETATEAGTVNFNATGVNWMLKRTVRVVFGIRLLLGSKIAVVMFKFHVPGPRF